MTTYWYATLDAPSTLPGGLTEPLSINDKGPANSRALIYCPGNFVTLSDLTQPSPSRA
jgi:hypothetical protein